MKEMLKILVVACMALLFPLVVYGSSRNDPSAFTLDLATVIGMLLACYEALSRMIPTTKTWSIIGKVLEVLTYLSKLFDRKKK